MFIDPVMREIGSKLLIYEIRHGDATKDNSLNKEILSLYRMQTILEETFIFFASLWVKEWQKLKTFHSDSD